VEPNLATESSSGTLNIFTKLDCLVRVIAILFYRFTVSFVNNNPSVWS
jgi:hypothetical protein